MKNYIKITLGIFAILVLFTAVYYFVFSQKSNNIGNINSNNNTSSKQEVTNMEEVATDRLETLENKAVGYTFDYPTDKYEAETTIDSNKQNASSRLTIKGVAEYDFAIMFYSREAGQIYGRGMAFLDLGGYVEKDGEYYMGPEGEPLEILEVLDTELGKVLIIDGTQFDYSGPSMGPGEFGALVNLDNNKFTGIAIQPNTQNISYDEFVNILKTLRPIDIDYNLLEVDDSGWTTFESLDLGISHKISNSGCKIYRDSYLSNLDPVVTVSCSGRNGMQIMYEPLNYYRDEVYDFGNMTLEEVANTFYNVTKNFNDGSSSTQLGGSEKIQINGYDAYKFSLAGTIAYPCKDDMTKSCGSRPLYYQDVIFISDGNRVLMIRKNQNHPVTDKVLESFKFIDSNSSVDTTDWLLYEDASSGVAFSYPDFCDMTKTKSISERASRSYCELRFIEIDYEEDFELKDIAQRIYNLSVKKEDNIVTSDLVYRKLDGRDAYEFSLFGDFFDVPCHKNLNQVCAYIKLSNQSDITITTNKAGNMLLFVNQENYPASKAILETVSID